MFVRCLLFPPLNLSLRFLISCLKIRRNHFLTKTLPWANILLPVTLCFCLCPEWNLSFLGLAASEGSLVFSVAYEIRGGQVISLCSVSHTLKQRILSHSCGRFSEQAWTSHLPQSSLYLWVALMLLRTLTRPRQSYWGVFPSEHATQQTLTSFFFRLWNSAIKGSRTQFHLCEPIGSSLASAWCRPSSFLYGSVFWFLWASEVPKLPYLLIPGFPHLSKASEAMAYSCQLILGFPRLKFIHLFVLLVGLFQISSGKERTFRNLTYAYWGFKEDDAVCAVSLGSLCDPPLLPSWTGGSFRVSPEFFKAMKVLVWRDQRTHRVTQQVRKQVKARTLTLT